MAGEFGGKQRRNPPSVMLTISSSRGSEISFETQIKTSPDVAFPSMSGSPPARTMASRLVGQPPHPCADLLTNAHPPTAPVR